MSNSFVIDTEPSEFVWINDLILFLFSDSKEGMAGKVAAASPASFEYEIFESDKRLQTVVTTSKQTTMWIDPGTLKLRHRIGRGPFGETWLATLHRSMEDYDECHEVAVKMLHPVKDDNMRVLLDKLDDLFSKCQGVEGVCCLQGISAMNGKVGEVLLVFLGIFVSYLTFFC